MCIRDSGEAERARAARRKEPAWRGGKSACGARRKERAGQGGKSARGARRKERAWGKAERA
eukprot:215102-Alexandrium_andersonii.AAC.1